MKKPAPRFPFPSSPSSWYNLAWSDEVARGRTLHVRAFETEVDVARDRDGQVRVNEARGRRRALPVCERNGLVFAYYDATGAPPTYEIPEAVELHAPGWAPVGRLEFTFRSHVQEVIENSVDLSHFVPLHRFMERPRLTRFEVSGKSFTVAIESPKTFLGARYLVDLSIAYHGMGLAVGFLTRPLPLLSLVTCLPIDGEHIRQRLTFFARMAWVPVGRTLLCALLLRQLRRDLVDEVKVLDHKRYLTRPLLVAGDGPIMKVRKWCRQFYPLPASEPGVAVRAAEGDL